MEILSAFNTLQCITLIFSLFTGNTQAMDSILVNTDMGDEFHITKKIYTHRATSQSLNTSKSSDHHFQSVLPFIS